MTTWPPHILTLHIKLKPSEWGVMEYTTVAAGLSFIVSLPFIPGLDFSISGISTQTFASWIVDTIIFFIVNMQFRSLCIVGNAQSK